MSSSSAFSQNECRKEESYLRFIDSLNDGFELLKTVVDAQGNIIDFIFLKVNHAYETQSGLRAIDIIGKRKKEAAPASEQRWYDYAIEASKTAKILSYEYFNPKVNRIFETQFLPILPNQIVVLFRDITERKRAEEAVRLSQERFEQMVEQSPVVFEVYDLQGYQIRVNNAYEKFWNIPKELTLKKYNIRTSPQVKERGLLQYVERAYAGEVVKVPDFEYDASLEPSTGGLGRKRWLNATLYPLKDEQGKVTGIAVLHEDVTERKKAEEAKKETEERLQNLFEQSPAIFEIYDKNGLLIRANRAWEKAWQTPRTIAVGKWNVLESEQIKKTGILPYVNRAYAGEAVVIPEKEFDASLEPESQGTGVKRLLKTEIYPIKNESGEVTDIVVMHQDITEHKRAEEALKQTERNLESVLEKSPFAFALFDKNGLVVKLNDAWEQLWQIQRELVIGKYSLLQSDQITNLGLRPVLEKVLAGQTVKSIEFEFDPSLEPLTRGLGRRRWISVTAYSIKTKSGPNFVVLAEDITDRRNLERQLQENMRLAAIGQTAGMVGHDIRNPLQAVMGETYLLKEELASSPQGQKKETVAESLDSIEKNVVYINKIVQDLQDFARPITPEMKETNLSDIFVSIFETVRLPDSIKLNISIHNAEKISTDPLILQRALTNLVNNAIQAMPDGGELIITGQPKGDGLVITVADTGTGIPEEIRPKLFTPMVTTKAKGQGFGLAATKRIIEALKGKISFESEEGKGTKFIIELSS